MDQNRKLELINLAIQTLSDEKKKKNQVPDVTDDDAEYQHALSRLLSELEMLKGDGKLEQSEDSSPPETDPSATEKTENKNDKVDEKDEKCIGNDDIVKELEKLKRQNFVTHCLLSAMIVLTAVWQLSEVSIALKVKDGLNHPFRALGNWITGMFKVPDRNGQLADDKEQLPEPSAHPSLNIPEMPHVDMSNLGFNNNEE